MENFFKVEKALMRLMPKGGWMYDGENIIICEDGVEFGYSIPTQNQINEAIAIDENNDPILAELETLDKYVPRAVEDLIIAANTDSYLVGKANEKKILRSKLK